MPAGGHAPGSLGGNVGRPRVVYQPPPQRPQPVNRPTASREQAPSRPAPRPKPKPVNRPAASREQRPDAVAASPAARMALLRQLAGAFSPPPSPDRTTGREFKGFASNAFTGQTLKGGADASNGFFPDAQGARIMGYGMQAGNPRQQKVANIDATGPGGAQENGLKIFGQKVAHAVGNIIAAGPIGAGVGNVVAQQTWDKLAPLFQRSPGDMPRVSFKTTPTGVAGFTFTGAAGRKAGVTISPQDLQQMFSIHARARSTGRQDLQGVLSHEFAHTQQGNAGPASSGGKVAPVVEGGADAFAHSVAPLFGRAIHGPATSPVVYKNQTGKTTGIGRQPTSYGRSEIQNFMSGGQPNQGGGISPYQRNLYKTLIQQFPRVKQRMTPISQQRPNLAQ